MPARLGGVAAHALGGQAQSGRPARLRSQLQAPPDRQAKRGSDFGHDTAQAAIAQRLFRDGQRFGLIFGHSHQQPRRVEPVKPQRVQLSRLPAFAHP